MGGKFMKCRRKEELEYLKLSRVTASECLDLLGYGKELCNKTYAKDKRFGDICDDCIKYGFKNQMYGSIQFGHYIVFGACDDGSDDILDEEHFFENYEII